MVSMRAPKGSSGFSHNGESHITDLDGFIDVPEHAVEAAKSHGFVVEDRPDDVFHPVKPKAHSVKKHDVV